MRSGVRRKQGSSWLAPGRSHSPVCSRGCCYPEPGWAWILLRHSQWGEGGVLQSCGNGSGELLGLQCTSAVFYWSCGAWNSGKNFSSLFKSNWNVKFKPDPGFSWILEIQLEEKEALLGNLGCVLKRLENLKWCEFHVCPHKIAEVEQTIGSINAHSCLKAKTMDKIWNRWVLGVVTPVGSFAGA